MDRSPSNDGVNLYTFYYFSLSNTRFSCTVHRKRYPSVVRINGDSDGTSLSIWHLYFWQGNFFFTYVCQIIASIERVCV